MKYFILALILLIPIEAWAAEPAAKKAVPADKATQADEAALKEKMFKKTEEDKKIKKPEEILKDLMAGNEHFAAGQFQHPHQSVAYRKSLRDGQDPRAIIVSCSDSRVPPEIVFDQGLGDIFVVRVAGNVVNPENIASIEFAVTHLGSNLIIVMGHDSCGAVRAAVNTGPDESAGSPSLDVLVKGIQSNIQSVGTKVHSDKVSLDDQAKANTHGVIKDILKQSSIIRGQVKQKNVLLKPAMYSLETGKVQILE